MATKMKSTGTAGTVTMAQYGGSLGIGGPNGTPCYVQDALLPGRITVSPVSGTDGIVTAVRVHIPGVDLGDAAVIPFKGPETVKALSALFSALNVRAEGRRNRSDASQMAQGLLPVPAGGNPGIWTGRRNGSGTSGSILSRDAVLAALAGKQPAKAKPVRKPRPSKTHTGITLTPEPAPAP